MGWSLHQILASAGMVCVRLGGPSKKLQKLEGSWRGLVSEGLLGIVLVSLRWWQQDLSSRMTHGFVQADQVISCCLKLDGSLTRAFQKFLQRGWCVDFGCQLCGDDGLTKRGS